MMGAEKATIFVGQENLASNRVAQKCGGKIVSESAYHIYLLFFLYFKGEIPFVLLNAFPK